MITSTIVLSDDSVKRMSCGAEFIPSLVGAENFTGSFFTRDLS